jgi:hypothetical protein
MNEIKSGERHYIYNSWHQSRSLAMDKVDQLKKLAKNKLYYRIVIRKAKHNRKFYLLYINW